MRTFAGCTLEAAGSKRQVGLVRIEGPRLADHSHRAAVRRPLAAGHMVAGLLVAARSPGAARIPGAADRSPAQAARIPGAADRSRMSSAC